MTTDHPATLGTLERLWRYPIKSFAAQPMERADVGTSGIAGDRTRTCVVATPEHARAGKPYRGKEHERLHTVSTVTSARALASERGIALDVHDDGPYFDDAPVSVVLDRWIAELEALSGQTLDPRRFRPNLFVRAAADARFDEAELTGRTLDVGTVRLRVLGPTERCVVPSYDLATGARDGELARIIALERNNVLGIYCSVERSGTVGVGDAVTLGA